MNNDDIDFYAVLGVDPKASHDEIKSAYRQLARELHPDVNPDPETQEKFNQAGLAWETLGDTGKRIIYDRHREFLLRQTADSSPYGRTSSATSDVFRESAVRTVTPAETARIKESLKDMGYSYRVAPRNFGPRRRSFFR